MKDLQRRIELYLRRNQMTRTRFGREAMNDPRFVSDLRSGRKPDKKTAERVFEWLDSHEFGR